jgi:Rne/Rng family ribonuclease
VSDLAPAEGPAPQPTADAAPGADALVGEGPASPQNPASGPGGFVPGPPRVGMRPAIVRPSAGRMSFSSGKTRHQFRPSGFRPPRPFTPPTAAGASAEAPPPDVTPEAAPATPPTPPETDPQVPPQAQTPPAPQQPRPQHAQHRGPMPQQHGGGRGEHQRGDQNRHQQSGQHRQGGGQQGQQRGGAGGGRQQQQGGRHDQQRHDGGRQGNRGQQGQHGQHGQHGQRQPHGRGQHGQQGQHGKQPAPAQQPDELLTPVGESTQPEIQPLPPQPPTEDALTPNTLTTLQPTAAADAAALAPFAEDIEIDETLASQPAPRRQPTGRDMLINVVEGEEIRIAVVRHGKLEELYMERSSTESHIGNIYKGRVTNVEPSIQAAFIDFGIGKNGFLHISDLHPQYFPKKHQPKMPQQHNRRQGQPPRPQPPAQAPAPAPGFQPPAPEPSAAGDVESAPPAPAPLAHDTAPDAPAVAVDVPPAEPVTTPPAPAADASVPPTETGVEPASAAASPETSAASPEPAAGEVSPSVDLDAGNGDAAEAAETADATEAASDTIAATTEGPAAAATPANGTAMADPRAGGVDEVEVDDEDEDAEEAADFGAAYNSAFDEDGEFDDEYDTRMPGAGDDIDDGHMKPMEKVGRKTPRRDRPPIQQCLRRGQEVIVQVTKEGIGTKGPTLTSYVSCPGRYLVMMPGMAQLGVSRKIEDLDQRRELKRTLQELNPPRNLGFIIRTAGTEVAKKELQGDLNYLVRMWKVIASRIRSHKAPVELYQESDLVIRTIRDVFNEEIDRIIVDNEQVASRIRDFLSIVDPRSAGIVELYTGTMPLFQKFGVEREIEKINSRRVELPNGGSLVIDSTEALVAIDVNSGRYREQRDAEMTAFNMNKEALKEVVRQLRLRDLGGVIVIDFIDMREERHKREIERLLQNELKDDRAKTKVLRMSQFCMIEMTRQRVRPSLKRSIYMDCPHCHGSALIKTPESVSLDVMRRLAAGATRLDVVRLEVKAYPTVAAFLLNRKRKALVELEEKTGKRINITADDSLAGDQIVIQPHDARGSLLNLVL